MDCTKTLRKGILKDAKSRKGVALKLSENMERARWTDNLYTAYLSHENYYVETFQGMGRNENF